MKKAVICLAEGFEDVEAVMPIDLLRRAGVSVTVAGVTGWEIVSSRGLRLVADALLADLVPGDADALILPGGMPGASNLAASSDVTAWIKACIAQDKIVAAICASPAVVLGKAGVLKGKRFTCYPGNEKDVTDGIFVTEPVVIDGNIVTSRGVGTADAFALELIRLLAGKDMRDKVAKATLIE
ncbi:DJ-1 family glyoxalase III [Spirochaetia bacterium 38H-sp]|uniref:DJ-1 family glyoxalase III n=1 Tax=Rarispira pelagica TaxID=3141764 RepID=A0ABU9UDU0_9SPIR